MKAKSSLTAIRAAAKATEPFLKWAGGKRWLVYIHPELFNTDYNRYIEPFLGSGTVFFHMLPTQALLSDRNAALIETYTAIKSDWRSVYDLLEQHQIQHNHDHYYKIREAFFDSIQERAARFIYLNRTCWNGLYRVNSKNQFNVPIGTKTKVIRESRDEFKAISDILHNADILVSDFESVIDRSNNGDLLFVDPPYTVMHDNNGFIKYNDKLFSWNDQVRLRDAVVRARSRGVKIIVTNADHQSIKELYSDFEQFEAQRTSVLASDVRYRGKVKELIITA